jgi:hypothetical protein
MYLRYSIQSQTYKDIEYKQVIGANYEHSFNFAFVILTILQKILRNKLENIIF